jgi:hypothetical protein
MVRNRLLDAAVSFGAGEEKLGVLSYNPTTALVD